MAHNLTQRKNGFIEFAALGLRKECWHGLGQYLEEGQTIEQWKIAAGMDWEVFSSPVIYQAGIEQKVDDSRQVLFRSDNQDVLSVMSKDYKIVQPGEVLEFFNDLVVAHGMKLSAAGTLFGGKKYWAIAELGKSATIVGSQDLINGHLLLTTSADGTMATTAKVTSTRVVCNNTLQVALSGAGKVLKCNHSKVFDPKEFKIDLGLIDQSWDNFIGKLRSLANTEVHSLEAKSFFEKYTNPQGKEKTMQMERQLDALWYFYQHGAGHELSFGTQWGLLNAVTEMHTHQTSRIDPSRRFDNSEFGKNNSEKNRAYQMLLEGTY